MPLLQGQPFKLIKPPDILPLDSEVYTIQHTGEKFLNKSDYEDRLALYSQNIWTCQCTGHTGMTHKEAWMSEAKCRVAAKNAVPYALQKPLLSLVHHSLSPLEQLIDAASILCHSQYHVGEDVLLLYPKQISVKIVNCKENSKMFMESCKEPHHSLQNGLPSGKEATSLLNGNSNGMAKSDGVDLSPGKENQVKDVYSSKEESSNKRDMLPKLYDVKTLEDKKLIEDVPSKNLLRPYKVPSKDQIRLFIRSCALRHRGSTCTPWVVSEDLVKKFNISNKLPSLFLSSPKPNLSSSSKRKAQSPVIEMVKRPKADLSFKKQTTSEVSSVIVKTDIKEKPVTQLKMMPQPKKEEGTKTSAKNENPQHSTQPVSQNNKISLKSKSPSWGTITKHPLSMGKPKILPKPSSTSTPSPAPSSSLPTPRKRGRPPLSKEEKERNRLLRQKTLIDLSNKISNPDSLGALNIIKVTTNTEPSLPPQIPFSTGSTTTSSYLQPASSVVSTPYRSPVKRATTPESIMKLPVMKRFVHEYKTIKGVLGQFRRYAYTMDLVLSKLSPAQIDMIPDEALKKDLYTRQKKVQDKKFFEKLTPEEKKQFLKDKARTVALERWKERKLKNLKVEDKLVHGLAPLPAPTLVETPQLISNAMFGDIVMITDFIKCFRELLLGEEKFKIPSTHLMEAAVAGPEGYQIITDLICCFLPTIIHDDISKNCKEIGVPISSIPISYQTAHELARLCLTKQEEEESFANIEDNYLLGKEKNELSDDLLSKLECCELWELNCQEIICVLKALVHKALATAAISVYVEEIEEKVLQTLRERRKFLKQVQKEQKAVLEKKKEERKLNKIAKDDLPKKKRGRPKGYSPKIGAKKLQDYFLQNKKPETLAETVQKRRLSAENVKKEKAESLRLEKERQKQLDEIHKRHSMDKKYEEIVFKRDNLLRRTPIGFDRDHNRYWIFHTSTPGLYVEKGWVDHNTDYKYSDLNIKQQNIVKTVILSPVKSEIKHDYDDVDYQNYCDGDDNVSAEYMSSNGVVKSEEIKGEGSEEENNKPLSVVKTKIKMEMEEENRPLSQVKSKLTLSPMKMTFRGRPPKETYILVDEDTQTFPMIGENKWYHYKNMDEVMNLLSCLSDQGQRESQLIAAININRDRLQFHFNRKPEPITLSKDSAIRVKESLKEDIIQIARELIEGWLGGIPDFAHWEAHAKEAQDVVSMGKLLIDVQRHMQLKNLKGIMAPVKKEIIVEDAPEGTPPEYEDVEGTAVEKWRDAVRSCRTYSRLHVLVGIFDSCIKWEKSMATRKCKVCRNKAKQDPLVMCEKCENSYHWYCLRPPLKEDPGEFWSCPACMPKKTRREEAQDIEQEEVMEDQDEKDDPTFSLDKRGRPGRPGGAGRPGRPTKKPKFSRASARESARQEKECVVCFGRIGLISCSKCFTSYHSECHNPPLMSRARKDWVCGGCKNPRAKTFMNYADEQKPVSRRNYFGNFEDMSKRRSGNSGPRDKYGRFLPGVEKPGFASASSLDGTCYEDDAVEVLEEEEVDYQVLKAGRSIRGAKAKALENIAYKNQDSRRSNRNRGNRKTYRDESEESSDDDEEEAEDSERDNENDSDDSNENNEVSSDEDDGDKIRKPNVVEESDGDGDGDSESGDTSAGDDDDDDDDNDNDDDDDDDDEDDDDDSNNKDVSKVQNEKRLTEPLKPTKQVQGKLEISTNNLERNSKIKTLSSSSSSSSSSSGSSSSGNSSSSGSSSGSSSSSSGSDSSSSESDSDGDGDGDGSNSDDQAFKESGGQHVIKTCQPNYRKKSPEVVDID